MKFGKLLFGFYVVCVTSSSLFIIEFISQKVNLVNGIDLPLLFERRTDTIHPALEEDNHRTKNMYAALDPHLGYAHGESEQLVKKLKEIYSWIDGFVVYSKSNLPDLEHPIILVIGGSTSDGAWTDHIWPEELSKLLAKKGISGTIVNGGTSGYSTNQELLKLVRDGLEFCPDIIISYSGVNEDRFSQLPYPMIHPYQRYTLGLLTRPEYSSFFPNTIYLLNRVLWGNRLRMSEALGVRSSRTLGQQYERNMALMSAIARASGANFYGIIQPNALVGPGGDSRYLEDVPELRGLRSLYGQIRDVPTRLPFVYSFISIFDGKDGVYTADGIHTTLNGDDIIAEKVLDLIYADLSARKTSGALEVGKTTTCTTKVN